MMRRVLVGIVIMAFAVGLMGQVVLSTSKSEVLIGDRLSVTLKIKLNSNQEWLNRDVVPGDTVPSIQILDQSDVNPNDNGSVSKTWEVAIYDTGYVRIPPVPVMLQGTSGTRTYYSNDIPIYVQGVVDSTGLLPIKPIVYEPVKLSDYVPYALGLLGLIVVIAGMVWWSKRPKKEEEIIEIEEVIPADVLALEKLRELEARELWQNGHIQDFHSALSHILREYLESRYDVAALESTTTEVRVMLKPLLNSDQFNVMMKMMQMEDLIKFAKAEPAEEVHAQHLDFVREFINDTRQESLKESADV